MTKINTIEKVLPRMGKEVHENGFKEAFDSIPYKERFKSRDEICRLCHWTIINFRVKISGKHRYYSTFEARELEKFFQSRGLDAWTGQPI